MINDKYVVNYKSPSIYGVHHYEAIFEQWKWGKMNFSKSSPFSK